MSPTQEVDARSEAGQPTITATEARLLYDRIKHVLEAGANLIIQAWESRAWEVLGYSSWADSCAAEFNSCWLRLPRETRREWVAAMTEAGMSTRAIASGIGVDKNTITADLRQVSESRTRGPESDVVDAEIVEEKPDLRQITGVDGKSYPRKPTSTTPGSKGRRTGPEGKVWAVLDILYEKEPEDVSAECIRVLSLLDEALEGWRSEFPPVPRELGWLAPST